MDSEMYVKSVKDAAVQQLEDLKEGFGNVLEALLTMVSAYVLAAEKEGAARYEVHEHLMDGVLETHPSRKPVDWLDFRELLAVSEEGPDFVTARSMLHFTLNAAFAEMKKPEGD